MKTLKELKYLHESGAIVTKPTRKRIAAQLQRTCEYAGCTESLAFKNSTARFCSHAHNQNSVNHTRAMNRKKKAAYNKRHGLERKTIKRNVKLGIGIVPTETLLYEDYKEPLREVEKGQGFGYYGVVALSQDRQLVQCHICGNLYPSVAVHLRSHKINGKLYKETYGLGMTTALIGDGVRENMQRNNVKKFQPGELGKGLVGMNELRKQGKLPVKGYKPSLEWRNKKGLCPDQVLEKIKTLADKLGHTPSMDEFRLEYRGKYEGSIVYQHGSYLKAVKKLGLKSAKEAKEHTSEDLLQNLVDFKERFGRIPMTSDFNRGLLGAARGTYIARFGSLNNARLEAGLNAVLPMPFGQIVEVDAEQYQAYKDGHGISKDAQRQRKHRKSKLIARILGDSYE